MKSDPVPSREYVYIMGDPKASSGVRYKAGRSNNLDRRRNEIATAFPEVQVMYFAKVSDVVQAEAAAHKALEVLLFLLSYLTCDHFTLYVYIAN